MDQITILFNPYYILKKLWWEENAVQPILSFKRLWRDSIANSYCFSENFNHKNNGKRKFLHANFWKNLTSFYKLHILFRIFCLFKCFDKLYSKDNKIIPTLTFNLILDGQWVEKAIPHKFSPAISQKIGETFHAFWLLVLTLFPKCCKVHT